MLRRMSIFLLFSLTVLSSNDFINSELHLIGTSKGELSPCPKSPNCVSTKSTNPSFAMTPLPYMGSRQESHARLMRILGSMKRCTVITSRSQYLHLEFKSTLLRFIDDVEFLFDNTERRIHFRSASRKGYYDFGVNRRRMREISERYLHAGEKNYK